jgi:hypothetical protein
MSDATCMLSASSDGDKTPPVLKRSSSPACVETAPPALKRPKTVAFESQEVSLESQDISMESQDISMESQDVKKSDAAEDVKKTDAAQEDVKTPQQQGKEKPSAMSPGEAKLLDSLVDLLHSRRISVDALLAVFAELETLRIDKEEAQDHCAVMEELLKATEQAYKKATNPPPKKEDADAGV